MISSIGNPAQSAYAIMRNYSTSTNTAPGDLAVSLNGSGKSAESAVDFSNMTGNELRDWANTQFKNGKITIDELMTFGAMTLAIPVDGSQIQDDIAMNTKTDFVGKALAGLQGALSRNDQASTRMLQSALNVMRRSQSGIDCLA